MSIDENTKLILMRVVIAAAGVLFFSGSVAAITRSRSGVNGELCHIAKSAGHTRS